jgi:hypothetical protein
MRSGPFIGLVLALLLFPAVALAAPRADALGPVATAAEPRDGFFGSIAASPAKGPAGTPVTVSGEGFTPGKPLDLVWRTVTGKWKVNGDDGTYHGREFAPVGYTIASVTPGADGKLSASFTVPEDFGFEHDIVVQDGDRVLTQTAFNLDIVMSIEPSSGPVGTPIEVTVQGIGWRDLENSWTLVYDNGFTGLVTSVTTGGTAKFTIPATGAPGKHVLRLVHGAFIFPYLNPEQNPVPDRPKPQVSFDVTPGEGIAPLAPEMQVQAEVRGLPEAGDLMVSPAFSGIGAPVEVMAMSLEPGKTYDLNWDAMRGNRMLAAGFGIASTVIASATADAEGNASFSFTAPDDLGGSHGLWVAKGNDKLTGNYWIVPTALPLDVSEGPPGTEFTIHLKGGGWSETANIYNVNYDNAYLGYACAFNSNGDITIHLTASGEPGMHYIDLYPGIYKGEETRPNNFKIPQLTAEEDHPGEDLPVFRFAFKVTE